MNHAMPLNGLEGMKGLNDWNRSWSEVYTTVPLDQINYAIEIYLKKWNRSTIGSWTCKDLNEP